VTYPAGPAEGSWPGQCWSIERLRSRPGGSALGGVSRSERGAWLVGGNGLLIGKGMGDKDPQREGDEPFQPKYLSAI